MRDEVINIESIGKKFNIARFQGYKTLRSVIARCWSPFPKINKECLKLEDKEFWALKDVSLSIDNGDVVGLIGRNGAGKSTLLKILSRIYEPTEGKAILKGRVGSLLEVGTGFHPELTGRENIFLNGAILGMKNVEIKRKFREIVEFAEIEKFLEVPLKHYSSGMYARLAFSVAAHLDPEILLVDEVLSVGDIAFQNKCIGKMHNLSNSGRTIIFVSHNMSSIESLCNRAVLLNNGEIIAKGSPREVVAKYITSCRENRVNDLKNAANREGTGEYIFERVWFSNEADKEISFLRSGETICINAKLTPTKSSKRISDCVAVIVVFDIRSNRLFSLRSQDKNIRFPLSGETTLTWKICALPLYEGDYVCNLFVGKWGGRDPIDFVPNALTFQVASGDFYNTGNHAGSEPDCFLVNFDFSKDS